MEVHFEEFANQNLLKKIEIILPRYTNENITKHLINLHWKMPKKCLTQIFLLILNIAKYWQALKNYPGLQPFTKEQVKC